MTVLKLFSKNFILPIGFGLFSITCAASSEATKNGLVPELFDKPNMVKVFDLGPSPYAPSKNIKLSCYVYPLFSVQELNEGEMGAKISVHYRFSNNHNGAPLYPYPPSKGKGENINDLCQQNSKEKELAVPNVGGYLWGVVSNYIFVKSADTFGGIGDLTISNALTGVKVFDTPYNANKPFTIKYSADKVSLTYHRPLKTSCVPNSADPNCWQHILKNNNVDAKVKIYPPNCQEAIKDVPDVFKDPERSIQITVKVYIEDLGKPKITYLDGDATCAASP